MVHLTDAPGHVNNDFSAGNPSLGVAGTTIEPAWLNMVQRELGWFLIQLGGSPVKGTDTQIGTAFVAFTKANLQQYVGLFIDFTPGGAVVAGTVTLVNDIVGVIAFTQASGLNAIWIRGNWPMPKKPTDVITPGMALYWDNTNGYVTTTSTGNRLCATANESKGNGDTTIKGTLTGAPSKPA
jgi:predicted RecA/RadA family phage recombinase